MKKTILIDADIIAFKSSARADQPDVFDPDIKRQDYDVLDCLNHANFAIDHIKDRCNSDDVILFFSPDDRDNFRKVICNSYKQTRNLSAKPSCYWPLVHSLRSAYESKTAIGIEGDDLMGIYQTDSRTGKTIIASSDKDMMTIEGDIYNFHRDEMYSVSRNQANYNWMWQTLVGDSVDHYSGAKGIGKVKAENILPVLDEDAEPLGYFKRLWHEVLLTFESIFNDKNTALTEAVRQARLARILRCTDYCEERHAIKLWTPNEEIWYRLADK